MPKKTYLDMAVTNYNIANLVLDRVGEDTGYIRVAGEHLCVAMELALMHAIEKRGVYGSTPVDARRLLAALPVSFDVARWKQAVAVLPTWKDVYATPSFEDVLYYKTIVGDLLYYVKEDAYSR